MANMRIAADAAETLHIEDISEYAFEQPSQAQHLYSDDDTDLHIIEPYQGTENLADYEVNDPSFEGETDWETDSSDDSEGSVESDDTITQQYRDFKIHHSGAGLPPSRPLPEIPAYYPTTSPPPPAPRKMPAPNVPKPGPAKGIDRNSTPEQWLEEAKQCHYLPEQTMKQLCERVKECLMEGKIEFTCAAQHLLIFMHRI